MEVFSETKRNILLLVIISLLPRVLYYFTRLLSAEGLPIAYDTKWYLDHAYAFLSGFHVSPDMEGIFYFGYYSILSILLLIFKAYSIVVLFQIITNALSVILVYKISQILFNTRTAVFAGIIYALNYQIIYWSIFIITDSFFITTLLLNVYFLIMSYRSDKKTYRYLFAASSMYMVFLRPTGIVTLTFILVYIMINLNFNALKEFLSIKCFLLLFFIILIAVTGIIMVSGRVAPLINSLENYMEYLLREFYATGKIFDIATPYDYKFNARLEPNHFNNFALSFFINNWKDILVLYGRRAVSFFGVWVWELGGLNMLSKLKYLLPFAITGTFGFIGLGVILKKKIFKEVSILFLVILSIQFFCMFFFMDSAYRYRVPSLIFIGIIIAFGIDRTIDICKKLFTGRQELIRD